MGGFTPSALTLRVVPGSACVSMRLVSHESHQTQAEPGTTSHES